MYKNIIFDWSGVVSDNFADCHLAIGDMFEELGLKKLSAAELKREWCQPYMDFYHKYVPDLSAEAEEALFRKYIVKYAKYRIYPGMKELLTGLKAADRDLIVLSADIEKTVIGLIERHGLENCFDKLYTGVRDKRELIKQIIEDHNFKPGETVIIGDSEHEVDAGKYAGIKTIAVTWGFKDEESLAEAKPDYIINDINELQSLILGKNKS
jgi:HAD superfamily hydrolase (TIGR01509 family)